MDPAPDRVERERERPAKEAAGAGAPDGTGLEQAFREMVIAHGLGFSGTRLDESDGEFAELPAWKIVGEELGRASDAEMLREELAEFMAALRVEWRELRETA